MLCFISAVQQSDSVIDIYILFHTLFRYDLSQGLQFKNRMVSECLTKKGMFDQYLNKDLKEVRE